MLPNSTATSYPEPERPLPLLIHHLCRIMRHSIRINVVYRLLSARPTPATNSPRLPGPPSQPNEQRSLVRCLDSASLGVDTCLVDGLGELRDHLMSYIEAVSTSQSDDLELVRGRKKC